MSTDIVSVIVRSVSFALLFQAIGAAFFAALFPVAEHSAMAIRRLITISAVGGMIAIVAHWALEATRMTGDFSGLTDASMQHRVFNSSFSTAHALQTLGLLLIACAAHSRTRFGVVVSCLGGATAVAGFLFVGHTSVHPWRALLGPLLAIHLLIVAFWFGALLPLLIVSRRELPNVAATVLSEFSNLATWLVPVIAIAGLIMTLFIARGVPSISEPYGALIVAKIVGFVALMGLAALNKWKFVPAIENATSDSTAALRRSVLTEFALIVAVLSVTAAMTSFFSPNE